jgi:broad specificity phosphatase PhoE
MHHQDIIPKKAVGINLPEYLAETFSYDPEYKTYIKPTDIVYPETNKDVSVRIKRFLRHLIANYAGTEKTILLVTHQAVCSEILKIVNNSVPNIKLEESIINNYEKGRVALVYSNGWTYSSA